LARLSFIYLIHSRQADPFPLLRVLGRLVTTRWRSFMFVHDVWHKVVWKKYQARLDWLSFNWIFALTFTNEGRISCRLIIIGALDEKRACLLNLLTHALAGLHSHRNCRERVAEVKWKIIRARPKVVGFLKQDIDRGCQAFILFQL